MAVRRTRPPQPLAPHGLPGHLVEFVEALRGQGISVGPSETVDAGQVMSVLGLGDRETLREGFACAVLRRPEHRPTYDALFDLWWPAALGGRTVLEDDDSPSAPPTLDPEDVEGALALDLTGRGASGRSEPDHASFADDTSFAYDTAFAAAFGDAAEGRALRRPAGFFVATAVLRESRFISNLISSVAFGAMPTVGSCSCERTCVTRLPTLSTG